MAQVPVSVLDLVRRRREPAVVQSLRSTVAAVVAYLAALHLSPDRLPLLAPLTAVLVVQVSLYATLTISIKRIITVVVGLLIAVAFGDLAGVTWGSLGILVLASLAVGHLLRLGELVPEVAVSALLALGLSNPATHAVNHLVEALIGAGAGILVNLVVPPPVYVQPASEAVEDLAARMSGLLRDVGAQLKSGATKDRSEAWLRAAHRLDREIARVEQELTRAEESLRFNPRALPLRHAGRVLRDALDSLERCSVSLRSLSRSLHDLGREREPNEPIYTGGSAALMECLLRRLAVAVNTFGRRVAAQAVADGDRAERDLSATLVDARELQEHLTRSLRATQPGSWELHGAVLANAAHIIDELESAHRSSLHEEERRADRGSPPSNGGARLERLPWFSADTGGARRPARTGRRIRSRGDDQHPRRCTE
ncbi:aromatic acid exporter family protein [Streptomyces sp. NPDC059373]